MASSYRGMGSGRTPCGLGFALQDFSLDPRHPNCYAPHVAGPGGRDGVAVRR